MLICKGKDSVQAKGYCLRNAMLHKVSADAFFLKPVHDSEGTYLCKVIPDNVQGDKTGDGSVFFFIDSKIPDLIVEFA